MLQIFGQKSSPEPKKPRKRKRAEESARSFVTPGNKIHFISLGCPRNLVDSEVMLGILLQAGYEVAGSLRAADYIVINSCGFLEASRQESLSNVDEALKQRKQGAKVIVTGCMVQIHSEEVRKQFPAVDYLLGSGDIQGILQAVQSAEPGSLVTTAKSYLQAGEVPRVLATPRHYAYLKIAEGCRKNCAYCIIPTIKGPLQSKSEEQILREFQLLLDQGVREVILIAQDLADYGKDAGSHHLRALVGLLKRMLKVEGDYWLRLLYLYPDEITDELIALMASDRRLCPYLDMPIQHINDAILKSMKRATNKERIINTIAKLRRAIPDMSIRTSLIVGFPGETESQFEELLAFVQEHPLDNIGVFKYSREPGTPAAEMPNQVDEETKTRRRDQLMQVQHGIVCKRNAQMVGRILDVVIDDYHPESKLLMVGRHAGQCPEIDGQILINDARKVRGFGQRYRVEITDYADYDLVGRVL
jgi:ribosomal protein S12 methylthiotransferase